MSERPESKGIGTYELSLAEARKRIHALEEALKDCLHTGALRVENHRELYERVNSLLGGSK